MGWLAGRTGPSRGAGRGGAGRVGARCVGRGGLRWGVARRGVVWRGEVGRGAAAPWPLVAFFWSFCFFSLLKRHLS